ncbi:uncharacterized protein LOC143287288 [Babylonia areolata]|uniref:uncharacterized protein LOC143287288 n=1 Tax=Babylonia areolata TaxID=304850 RepID=UPI003FD1752F
MKGSPRSSQLCFYVRIRQFQSLASVYSLSPSGSFMVFRATAVASTSDPAADPSSDQQKSFKRCVMLYFAPVAPLYKDNQLPEETKHRIFTLRHSQFCTYTSVNANVIALLGFLPQDIVGTSIFDYYHPSDLPQLLDLYKQAKQSVGQPVKSAPLRFLTHNGTYLTVTTELSTFVNPWDRRLEIFIAQHTVLQPPGNPNVFEEGAEDQESAAKRTSSASRALIHTIAQMVLKEAEDCVEQTSESECEVSSSETAGKSISSLYRQVNYSLNIRRFLSSHPKLFPASEDNSSEDVSQKDPSEDVDKEVEVQVEIPVCQVLSCSSSAQVHVSEQGAQEEVPRSPTSLSAEDPALTPEVTDRPLTLTLTEASLHRHTKAQEVLYLREAGPHLHHLTSRQRGCQKRHHPSGSEEGSSVNKLSRRGSSKGERHIGKSGAGLFMSTAPISAVDVKDAETQQQQTNPDQSGRLWGQQQQLTKVPPWLQPGSWTRKVRLTAVDAESVLRKDGATLTQMPQSDWVMLQLQTLLEDVDCADHMPALDEESDYIFYPESCPVDTAHAACEMKQETPQEHDCPAAVSEKDVENGACEKARARSPTSEDQEKVGPAELHTADQNCSEHLVEVVISEPSPGPLHSVVAQTADMSRSPASEEDSAVIRQTAVQGTDSAPLPQCVCAVRVESSDRRVKEIKCPKSGGSDDRGSEEGSDRGSENCSHHSWQRNEEDVSPPSSRPSSSLTPSDTRSTEEAGSSWKESGTSADNGLTLSPLKAQSTESEPESPPTTTTTTTGKPDTLRKLFVPLKVWMPEGSGASPSSQVRALPFWQQEACPSEQISLCHPLAPLHTSATLARDRGGLTAMGQPLQIQHQLLDAPQKENDEAEGEESLTREVTRSNVLSEDSRCRHSSATLSMGNESKATQLNRMEASHENSHIGSLENSHSGS